MKRQRDLDPALVRAAPGVCDEIIRRLRAAMPDDLDNTTSEAKAFVLGARFQRDRDIAIVERFKKECG